MASFAIDDGHGIADNDLLLGAEADSLDLNIAALTFAETRLRYLLFLLCILFGLYILIAYAYYVYYTHYFEQLLFVMAGQGVRSPVVRRTKIHIVKQKVTLLMLLLCRPRVQPVRVRQSCTTQRACG